MPPLSLDAPGVKALDMSGLKIIHMSEAPQELFDRFLEAQETMLRLAHAVPPDTANHPAYKPYATVEVDGKVVAEIDNHGFVKMSNALGAKLGDRLPGGINGKEGPILAEARAAIIARFTGGTVRNADTAMTQTAFEALPQVKMGYDEAAIRADPMYENILNLRRARTAFLAQQLGQEAEDVG